MIKPTLFFKIAAPVVLLTILLGLLCSWLFYDVQSTELERIKESRQELLQHDIREIVNAISITPRELNQLNQSILSSLGNNPVDIERLRQQLFSQIQAFEDVDALYYGGENREFVGYARFGERIELMIAGQDTDYGIRFYAVDKEGKATTLLRERAEFPIRQRPWYLAAKAQGAHTWGDIFSYHAAPIMAAPSSAPVTLDGQFIGVIGNNIFLNSLSNHLAALKSHKEDRFIMVDENGLIVADSNLAAPFHIESGKTQRIALANQKDPMSLLASKMLTAKTGSTQIGTFEKSTLDQPYIFDVTIESGPNWKVFAYQDQKELRTLLQEQVFAYLMMHLIGVLFLAATVYALVRLIRKPIVNLRHITSSIANGDLNQVIHYDSRDELGELAQSFNIMTKRLSNTITELKEEKDNVVDQEIILEIANQKLSQQKQAIERLHERLALAVTAAQCGVWDWDVVNDQLYWDDRMYELYGIQSSHFKSCVEAWETAVHPEDKEGAFADVQSALTGEAEFNTSFRVVWPNGSVRYIRAFAKVIRNTSGKPLRMVGVNWDNTDVINSQRELSRANEELAQFAYRSSHDIRAPLISSIGLIDIIFEDLDARDYDEVRCNLQRIRGGLKRLSTLVSDILYLSKADFLDSQTEPVTLEPLVHELFEDIRSNQKNHVVLRSDIDADLMIENVQRVRLIQVLKNLIENGVKYDDESEETPFVEVRAIALNNGTEITVTDNDIGIPEHCFDKIYSMFARFHPERADGSGLGMAIVKKHVDAMGASIAFKSRTQARNIKDLKGTCFTVYIPQSNSMSKTLMSLEENSLPHAS